MRGLARFATHTSEDGEEEEDAGGLEGEELLTPLYQRTALTLVFRRPRGLHPDSPVAARAAAMWEEYLPLPPGLLLSAEVTPGLARARGPRHLLVVAEQGHAACPPPSVHLPRLPPPPR